MKKFDIRSFGFKMNKSKKLTFSQKITLGILAALAIAAALVWVAIFQKPDKNLHVWFYDVGQGDAIFIQSPENFKVLIDGGSSSVILSKLGQTLPFYDRKIDLVVSTHPHADHIAGLVLVLENYQVSQIWLTGVVHTAPDYLEFLEKIKEKNIPTRNVQAGESQDLGDGAWLKVVGPVENFTGRKIDNLNNTSIVLKLDYGTNSILFTGDAEQEEESKILLSGQNLRAQILKVPHQGSKNGLTETFLKVVNPEVAIILVGANNRFGHPHKSILEMLKDIQVLRTDQDGTIEVILDKEKYEIKKLKIL